MRKRRKRNSFFIFKVIVAIVILTLLFIWLDKKLFYNAIIQAKFEINNQFNQAINKSMCDVIKQKQLVSNDFYTESNNSNGQLKSLATNTILLNQLCSQLAIDIPKNFASYEFIEIPIGSVICSMLGVNYFSNYGPMIKLRVLPMSNVSIDFDSKFTEAGVNQTNFQIWLNINFNARIVNPLQSQDMNLKKRVAIVNTIINGQVPNTFLKGRLN